MDDATDTTTAIQRLLKRRILIVDDDPDVLAILKQAMQSEGGLTQCCSDGNTAVHICEGDAPDLLILDMMLPKRSGFLVLERVKLQDNAPVTIMVTANEGKRHEAYAKTLGVDAYMHKPLRLEKLIDTAVELLRERDKHLAAAAPPPEAPEAADSDAPDEDSDD